MARLTNDERDYMVSQLMKPMEKQINDNILELAKAVDDFCLPLIPNDLLAVMQIYPFAIKQRTSLNFGELFPKCNDWGPISPLKYYIEGIHKNSEINKNPKVQELWNIRLELVKKRKALKGRLQCVLESITTEKRLKGEFPEAYNILMKRYDPKVEGEDIETTSNLCDSIENVRAELSTLNSKKKEK